MDVLICKRNSVGGLVGGTEWCVGDQTVKVVSCVGRKEFHLCTRWKLDGAIALTTLKIEEDASVILDTKYSGCV